MKNKRLFMKGNPNSMSAKHIHNTILFFIRFLTRQCKTRSNWARKVLKLTMGERKGRQGRETFSLDPWVREVAWLGGGDGAEEEGTGKYPDPWSTLSMSMSTNPCPRCPCPPFPCPRRPCPPSPMFCVLCTVGEVAWALESERKGKWKKVCGQRTTGTRGSLRSPRGPKNVPYITANYQCPAPAKGWSLNIDNVDLHPWLDWTLLLDKLRNCTKETPILYQIKHNQRSFLSWKTSSNVQEHWELGLHRFALLQSDISMQCISTFSQKKSSHVGTVPVRQAGEQEPGKVEIF